MKQCYLSAKYVKIVIRFALIVGKSGVSDGQFHGNVMLFAGVLDCYNCTTLGSNAGLILLVYSAVEFQEASCQHHYFTNAT